MTSAATASAAHTKGAASNWPVAVVLAMTVLALEAIALWAMGRVPICDCGFVKLWQHEVMSAQNSQHLLDWYSFSHVIHGFLFYGLLALVMPRATVATRFVAALVLEAGWEILENTDMIINRYRAETISLDYFGDSILNSLSDTLAAAAGFLFAWLAPVWVTVAAALGFEVFTALMIRDNLLLNIIMLLHPIDAIKAWQGGA